MIIQKLSQRLNTLKDNDKIFKWWFQKSQKFVYDFNSRYNKNT